MRRPFPANFFALNGVLAMLKKLLMLCVALVLSLSAGFAAAVEVNSADQATLETVKGIGPVHAKAIIDERTKNGPFKDADDLATRVKGIGTKSVTNLEAAGLTINGSSTPPSGTKAATKSATPSTTANSTPATKTQAATSAATNTTAAPAATAASAPAAASSGKASKSKKKSKEAASEAAATSAPAAAAASAPAEASGGNASKTKKAKKSKAASAAAASGT
jgi:competence protein ComEA